MSDRDDLIALFDSWNLLLPEPWDDDSSLIRSGVIDSVALLELLMWLEGRLGRPLDPSTIDLAGDLDTVRDIIRYVETNR